jgi:hypothetical protein
VPEYPHITIPLVTLAHLSPLSVTPLDPVYPHTTGRPEEFHEELHPLGLPAASQYIARLSQKKNASSPIEVMLLRIVTLVRLVQR